MTHWVLRMYENKTLPLEDPRRFKVRPPGARALGSLGQAPPGIPTAYI